MTPKQVSQLVALIVVGFPTFRLTTATSALYERMLADLDVDAATAAVERLLATAKYPPTIAEIRDATLTVARGERRPGGDAWGDVLRAVGRWGAYRTPVFDDPVTARAVAALGWEELCLSETQASDRARFIELYDQLAVQTRQAVLVAGLPSGERYQRLREGGDARPLSEAVGKLLATTDAAQSGGRP